MLSKLSIRTKISGLMHLVVLQTNTEWSVVRSERNDYVHSCSTRTLSWCQHQSNFLFFESDTVELERHIFHTIKFEKHDRSLFLLTSESPRIVIETANDRLEGSDGEPRMVLYKQSNRPDHDCIKKLHSLTSSRRRFAISSKLQ